LTEECAGEPGAATDGGQCVSEKDISLLYTLETDKVSRFGFSTALPNAQDDAEP